MTKEAGLYVHIPFCVSKCAYCDFPSFPGRLEEMEGYIQRVLMEAEEKSQWGYTVSTLYIGGGTPSLMKQEQAKKLLKGLRRFFPFAENAECSCECNPGTVTPAFLAALREGGVNRLSFGAQARQPRLLSLLGRIHSWEQAEESIRMARAEGFENLNLDLMLGLPGQTLADVEETLNAALALSPTHVSCYGLIVEEGTKMERMVSQGAWGLPPEDVERDMYELCRKRLSAQGFVQYEISNFSLPGMACRHNVDCWRRKEYIGLGCAACGFTGNRRYRNPPTLEGYFRGDQPEEIWLTQEDAQFESVMLGLRMMEGVSEEAFLRMHGVSLRAVYGEKLKKPLAQGLVELQDGYLRLTRRGMDVQNAVLVELL